jgi:predicted HTH transcriptional regulator
MDRESRSLEYKREAPNLQKLAKTVVAFANGDGGRIIVGVDDRTRAVIGLAPEQIDDLLERMPSSLADQIQPPVIPQVFERTISGREVLVIQVFPCNQKPCFLASEGAEKGVYVRVGCHTRRAPEELLDELRLLRSRLTYDEEPIAQCPNAELDRTVLPANLRSEKALSSLGALRRDPLSGTAIPTRGAILMLHPSPDRHVPEAVALVSRMRGEHGRHTIESHEVTGNLPHQADAVMALLEQWLGREAQRSGARYRPRSSVLPLAAVREAISNALFHRQYSIPGAIKIALYATHLEIFSPGHFAGPFIAEELGDGTSYIRNRVICHLARRLGLIEKRGTGIRLMQDAMAEAGLGPPEFVEGQLSFKVSLAFAAAGKEQTAGSGYEDRILVLYNERRDLTSTDVCRHLNVSRATAVAALNRLTQAGRLRRTGRGPQTRYVMGSDPE